MGGSDTLDDHRDNPRNRGVLDDGDAAVGTGLVGSSDCGDVLQLQIKVREDGIIEDARFKTFGCGNAVASSSLVTEWLKGRTLTEAAAIRDDEVAAELALPPVRTSCTLLAEDAIKAAIADYRRKRADGG